MKSKVTLILGGNRGDRELLLNEAVKFITERNTLLLKSSVYETEAWGGIAEGPFLNQVIQVRSSFDPMTFLGFIQKIETDLGRRRAEHWGDRTMDIDVLFWNDRIIDTPELKIPHPFMSQRKFVLVPLAEILPEFVHPIWKKTSRELLSLCEDDSIVYLYKK
ncbi:2-amino-4-hydroxy-6-hydroxymethyldihydropteridine diphosphokinase [Algoriphagus lutimaris]|uniref:2-amino-4-hydroxy-6- hydroxymethyldihydropteridine diphosphokinase n=1 Tax=Algoriphagus lutimaris TaxID=613197 RepID=UPI00196A40EC|nr:2-amino-4-hydroxy-6-hydroxymethyldihydropteridine diphosphokinase [Algoriphagus lutimaris]MBN3522119.1 2-amino-4-hydroxy-6-hydroxymethyldihydropteridine diphosphokinase [Algoriphagus lutimaris]